jgi:hypothetical protein
MLLGQLAVRSLQLAVGSRQLAVGSRNVEQFHFAQDVRHEWQSFDNAVVSCQHLPTAYCQLPTAYPSPPIVAARSE